MRYEWFEGVSSKSYATKKANWLRENDEDEDEEDPSEFFEESLFVEVQLSSRSPRAHEEQMVQCTRFRAAVSATRCSLLIVDHLS